MRVLKAIAAKKIAESWGHCTGCEQLVPADTIEEDGGIWLVRRCPVHGESRALQSRHPRYYRMIETILPPIPDPALMQPLDDPNHLRGVFIDVTERCNMQCPNCLTDANAPPSGDPPTVEGTLRDLAKMLPYKPVLYLTGGEPTLRPDILDWVGKLGRAGYDVKLLTNGLKMRDKDFCRAIRDAGVTWVLLQFDSQDEGSLRILRGRGGLSNIRREVIANCSELGMSLDLACMIDPEVNVGEMGELLRLGFRTPGVRHVSFMPSRRLGRGLLTTDENLLDEVQMMRRIEEQTNGFIKPYDWVAFLAATSMVYRATGSPDFAPRRCFLPLPLVGTAEKFYPITRPRGLMDPRNLAAFAAMASNGGRAESARWTERTLLTSIETFREPSTIDVGDASRCSRYYLVDGEVRQACLYNNVGRPIRRKSYQADIPDYGPRGVERKQDKPQRTGFRLPARLRAALGAVA